MGLCTHADGYVHPSHNFFFGGEAPLSWERVSPSCTPLLWEMWVLHLYRIPCCSLWPAGPHLSEKAPGRSPTPRGRVSPACCTPYQQCTSWMQPPRHACPRRRWWRWWGGVIPGFGSCCLPKNALTGNFSYPKIVACTWMPSWLSSYSKGLGCLDGSPHRSTHSSLRADLSPGQMPKQEVDVCLLPSPEARRCPERC